MATSAINENARVWNEDFFFPATGWWYRTHSVTTVRTVGFTDWETALAAAADNEQGVVSIVNRDAPGLYSVTIETDTLGPLTKYDPQPT